MCLKIKNANGKTTSVTNNDTNTKDISLDIGEIAMSRATVEDMVAIVDPQDGAVCIVKDLNRGGNFVYNSAEVANSNDGTNFSGWMRQYDGAVNVKWFGSLNNTMDFCISNQLDAYLPNGEYIVSEDYIHVKDNDCKNITIFGEGRGSVIKGVSANGSDVFQLNNVSNLHIKDIAITATIDTIDTQGTNAVSITGVCNNITIENVYSFNLPFADNGAYLDGGKAISIQTNTIKDLKVLNCSSYNCAYGCSLDLVGQDYAQNPRLLGEILINSFMAKSCYRGVSFGMSDTNSANVAFDEMSITIDGCSFIDCQSNGFARITGLKFINNTIIHTIPEEDLPVYRATDTEVVGLALTSIYGSVVSSNKIYIQEGEVALAYGALTSSAGDGTSADNVIANNRIKISTSNSGFDIKAVNSNGNIAKRTSFVNNATNRIDELFFNKEYKNVFIFEDKIIAKQIGVNVDGAQTNTDVDFVAGSIGVVHTDNKNCYNKISRDDSGCGFAVRQTLGSSSSLNILSAYSSNNTKQFGVRNDGGITLSASSLAEATSYAGKRIPIYDGSSNLIGYINLYN